MTKFNKVIYPKIIKQIDFENNTIIGCIPKSALSEPPHDQSPCIIEICSSCNKEMWVSEKKRKMKESKPNVKIYCMFCIAANAKHQNLEHELLDINSIN